MWICRACWLAVTADQLPNSCACCSVSAASYRVACSPAVIYLVTMSAVGCACLLLTAVDFCLTVVDFVACSDLPGQPEHGRLPAQEEQVAGQDPPVGAGEADLSIPDKIRNTSVSMTIRKTMVIILMNRQEAGQDSPVGAGATLMKPL